MKIGSALKNKKPHNINRIYGLSFSLSEPTVGKHNHDYAPISSCLCFCFREEALIIDVVKS